MSLSKGYLVGFAAALLALTILLVEPFIQYILGAILVAYALYPLQVRLREYTSPMIAAFTVVTLAVVGFVAPFVVIFLAVADDATSTLQNFDPDAAHVEAVETRIAELTGQEVDLVGSLAGSSQEIGSVFLERSTDAFNTITKLVIGVALTVFLVYYLVKDGDDFIEWLQRTVPLPLDVQRDLYDEIDDVMWAVLFGHVFVAIVQGVVAGVGLFATGVPNAAFWTAVMAVLAMVPIIGSIPVWGGAVVYLYLTGEPLLAAALFVYSVVVVGLTDDYLRPFAVNRYSRLNPAVILVGILGGGYAFGIMGLFFGPVVLGALKATLRVIGENWQQLDESETG